LAVKEARKRWNHLLTLLLRIRLDLLPKKKLQIPLGKRTTQGTR
jgi:hypothetical protein